MLVTRSCSLRTARVRLMRTTGTGSTTLSTEQRPRACRHTRPVSWRNRVACANDPAHAVHAQRHQRCGPREPSCQGRAPPGRQGGIMQTLVGSTSNVCFRVRRRVRADQNCRRLLPTCRSTKSVLADHPPWHQHVIVGLMERLVALRRFRLARELMLLYGLEVQPSTVIGSGLRLNHRGMGTVLHPLTKIGDRVTIYHQVTVGRADGHIPFSESKMRRIEIGDDVALYPGSKILGGPGVTRVGSGTIIAANAVVTKSTGDWEVWGGIPAKKIGDRPRGI